VFKDLDSLLRRFAALGATHAFCKLLAENDNSKQQVYLGTHPDALQMFPIHEVHACSRGRDSIYKASLDFFWISESSTERAAGAQIIFYPQYPEVRLSGFLKGCRSAPNEQLRPIPKDQRQFNNGSDGRVLVFGVTPDGRTLVFLASRDSPLAGEIRQRLDKNEFRQRSVFFDLPFDHLDSRMALLAKLAAIRDQGWHSSIRLNGRGEIVRYEARNGGGYTLEALLGIVPNGRAEPDYLGWEIKAHSASRITLMTPEPGGGVYGDLGVQAFVRRYGAPAREPDTLYFTGLHRAGSRNGKTGLTLVVRGFDVPRRAIRDVNGAVELLTDSGECAAAWHFADLMVSWNRKHAQAAYISYESEKTLSPAYRYLSPALLGEGTDFNRYLAALANGFVFFDPGSKVMNVSTPHATVKARSQFRTTTMHLEKLYDKFGATEF
jgi:hypothetical protein